MLKNNLLKAGALILFTLLAAIITACMLGDDMYTLQTRAGVTNTVTFDINGGSGAVPLAKTVDPGVSITIPNGDGLSKNGYNFVGWNDNASGTGTNYSVGSYYQPARDVTMYAKWDAKSYTVTFDINDGSGTAPNPQTADFDSSITLPSGNGIARTGYTFGGWNTLADGMGTNFTAGASYTITGEVTLYAKWNVITYTVTFNANGGSGTVPAPQNADYGTSITLPVKGSLTRTGYGFGGWNTSASGYGTNYNIGDSYSVTGNVTLYAKWNGPMPAGITFENFEDEAIDLSRDNRNDISNSRGDKLIVTVTDLYDSYAWYLNGAKVTATGNEIELDASDLAVGVHTLTAVVTKGGIPYSKELTFKVAW